VLQAEEEVVEIEAVEIAPVATDLPGMRVTGNAEDLARY